MSLHSCLVAFHYVGKEGSTSRPKEKHQDLIFSSKAMVLTGSKNETTLTGCDDIYGLRGHITCVALSCRGLSANPEQEQNFLKDLFPMATV